MRGVWRMGFARGSSAHLPRRSRTSLSPMFAKILGRLLFASGLAGLGVLSLWFGDFALVWQPVPDWVPGRVPLAYASGALLLAGGVGLLVRRTAVQAAAVMAVFLTLWLVLL